MAQINYSERKIKFIQKHRENRENKISSLTGIISTKKRSKTLDKMTDLCIHLNITKRDGHKLF